MAHHGTPMTGADRAASTTAARRPSSSSVVSDQGVALPYVSFVVVVRNEETNIATCLGHILRQEYPRDRLEIVLVDGMSEDRTREIAERMVSGAVPLRIVLNPGGQRARGLNLGIRAARGEVIGRVDARTRIEPGYLARCVRLLQETGADNVGGVMRPDSTGPVQTAIGLAMSHPFGAGDAPFRVGWKRGPAEGAYPGLFRRDVFDRVGLFDEQAAVISEDSDLNARILRSGGIIYLDPTVQVYYRPRGSLRDLWKLYFRYGGARAGNLLKHRRLRARQVVPPLFLLALVGLPGGGLMVRPLLSVWTVMVVTYLVTDVLVSVYVAAAAGRAALCGWLCAVFPCMHLAWGVGFWRRLTQRPRPGVYWGY